MKRFAKYVARLESLVASEAPDRASMAIALDGEACVQLRSLVDIPTLRKHGAFFTGYNLAKSALRPLDRLNDKSVILDPACGAGNLLLQIASCLPVRSTLNSTLRQWGKQLIGIDIVPEFVQATRYRLALAALSAGAKRGRFCLESLPKLLPGIQQADSLAITDQYKNATHVVMNPPFQRIQSDKDCSWRHGAVSAAAVFLSHCLEHTSKNTQIVGILPEVLRTGTSYSKWRKHIASNASKLRCVRRGRFSSWGDVDVFTFDLTVGSQLSSKRDHRWGLPRTKKCSLISDRFDVKVGTVVPHRHHEIGKEYAFVHARSVPAWGEVERINFRRRFEGRTFDPPFVVVRRTSRPDDGNRAIATIIRGNRPVAVENHLVVLSPYHRTLTECRKLLKVLKKPQTNRWLDNMICCRHLTVKAIAELPWWEIE